ncbi:MAG TPA: hypothetical protein VJ438_00365 [Candidatus Nanoarchaeia archaeon]|nr:hypothetical protein [Candidatus Nanoarchaeia archaeon]
MKIDPYKHKERYLKWKENNSLIIPDISKSNSEFILSYLADMEKGLNIGSSKGSRSFIRLNNLKQRMIFMSKQFEKRFGISDLRKINEQQLHNYFSDMRNGIITRLDGGIYKSVSDYIKVFKAFWHWHQKSSRKRGEEVEDITIDLDMSQEKPEWVYLDENQIKKLAENVKPNYRVLIMFLFDSGIRSPTELMNIKVSDFYKDYKEVCIREEISKTFGRRIKLMLCSELVKEFVQSNRLSPEDYLFKISPPAVNQYLKRIAGRLFGDCKSPAGKKYSELTMYDFRHCSCCYWLPRYKSESALKFRFGWKKSDKIYYYSEMLGMRDTISEEDILIDTTKTELEQEQVRLKRENEILKDKMGNMESQMQRILQLVDKGLIVVEN